MSFAGRRLLDGIKSQIGRHFSLPAPPYGNPAYWESAYLNFNHDTIFEWGDQLEYSNLSEYQYRLVMATTATNHNNKNAKLSNDNDGDKSLISTTWKETLQGNNCSNNDKEKSIMILGCGYSNFGKDMAIHEDWNRIMEVDIVSKAITDGVQRQSTAAAATHDSTSTSTSTVVEYIEDNARSLSAFSPETVHAIFDKGMLDTLYLANERSQIQQILASIHRVLRHKGIFVTLSLSEPQYLQTWLGLPPSEEDSLKSSAPPRFGNEYWSDVQVRKLDTCYLYRFQKRNEPKLSLPKKRKIKKKRVRVTK